LVGTREGKRPRGKLRRRWEDNIIMDFRQNKSHLHATTLANAYSFLTYAS
jgi:hypothetical protein